MHEGMIVADLGAGSGFFTRAAAREVGEEGEVWAVDINRELLPRIKSISAAEGLHNIDVVHGDVSVHGGTNLPDSHFDFVIAANIFFSLEEKHEAIAEIDRLLKPQGRALIIDWSESHGGLGPHPDHVFPSREALKLFEKHHFVPVKEVPAGAYHWGFIVRKKPQ